MQHESKTKKYAHRHGLGILRGADDIKHELHTAQHSIDRALILSRGDRGWVGRGGGPGEVGGRG